MHIRSTVLISSILFALASSANAAHSLKKIQDEKMNGCDECHGNYSDTLPNPKLSAQLHHKTESQAYQSAEMTKDDLMALLTQAE